jgi:hypothetical protein
MASIKNMIPFVFAISVSTFQLVASHKVSDPSTACEILKHAYPNITYLPEDAGYMEENHSTSKNKRKISDKTYGDVVSWDSAAWLGPSCVFVPTSATSLSFAVKTFVDTSTKFAMRGGGHMPIQTPRISTVQEF